jgi:F-type H+-transporting ATPase subunit gamma
MTRRHQLAARLAGFREVRAILSAMKNIALMELRALAGLLEHQRRAMATIERAAADFLCFYPPPGEAAPAASVCIVIGSERGFCGEFNGALEAEARAVQARGEQLVAIGARLLDRLEAGASEGLLAGANVTEELPTVLQQVAAELERVQRASPTGPLHVRAVYQHPDGSGLVTKTIAPLPLPERPPLPLPHPPQLTLAPQTFFADLLEQALLLSLQEAFSVSLIAENRRRLAHMEGALRRLDEITVRLARRLDASRQEEITQEIEVIMLSAEALAEEEAARSAL